MVSLGAGTSSIPYARLSGNRFLGLRPGA